MFKRANRGRHDSSKVSSSEVVLRHHRQSRLLRAVGLVSLVGSFACGAGSAPVDTKQTGAPDGGTVDRIQVPVPADFSQSVVLVNGLISDVIGDVRVCPSSSSATALPSDRPVALTNYPGIARGRGLDLGTFDLKGGIDVFSASAIKDKPSNCGSLRNAGPSTYTHVSVTMVDGPCAVILTDDPKGVVSAKTVALSVGVTPTVDDVAAQFAFAGTGLSATSLTLTFQTSKAQSDTGSASVGFLLPKKFDESVTVSDEPATFTYTQSLGSIQYVSDPTTDPATFFDARTQVLFVLVGDPKDPYEAFKPAEQLTGRELHLTAVPFTLTPKGSP